MNIAEQKMLTNSTQLTSCQVGHVDLVGKSNVCGIMVEGVAVAKPIELEGEVNCATDGRRTEHGLQNVRLRTRTILQIKHPFPTTFLGQGQFNKKTIVHQHDFVENNH